MLDTQGSDVYDKETHERLTAKAMAFAEKVAEHFDEGGSAAAAAEVDLGAGERRGAAAGAGDLDECNGMTVDGVYGYYITDAFPYIVACFRGIPNLSFQK